MSFYRTIRWEGARTSSNGLVVAFFGERDPRDESDRYHYLLTETESRVEVAVVEEMRPGHVGGGLAYMRTARVDLSRPLGERELTDASCGETKEAFDRMRLLRPPVDRSSWRAVTEGGDSWEWTTECISESSAKTAYIRLTVRKGASAELNPEIGYDETGQVELRGGKLGLWGLESRSHRHLRLSWKENSDVVDLAAHRGIGLDSLLAFAESLQSAH